MNNKYVCVHGHFYQPPRENAWLEEIEIQESAHPYHDWNERIANECYGPNAYSRILNEEGKIVDIVNNYARISFNFGPTLLLWLEKKRPDIYQSILDADKQSRILFDGCGSAMAQVYNHIIMPLANKRDKTTQVKWGLYDFKQRFKRDAEGMWLAETAVDVETLEVLAAEGVKYTVLAPYQAKSFREIGTTEWNTNPIDPTQPYLCNLPSGNSIVLFFYDGPRSQGVAFDGYLNDGKKFAKELTNGFRTDGSPQLMHIATDGESYGHHHKNGDMALAYCLRYIETSGAAKVCNYSYYLKNFPPTDEVEIHENTAWSCAHGVGRWKEDCSCHTGALPGWNQKWRAPLREALNWLRNEFERVYEHEVSKYTTDCWALRNDFIEVIFNRNEHNIEAFLKQRLNKEVTRKELIHIVRLLETQKQNQLMFTSCAWFFNEISGIETVQVLQYASRGIQLVERECNIELEAKFLEILAQAESNIPEMGTGADIYNAFVKPKQLSLTQVGMHYAVSTLFANEDQLTTVLNYDCSSDYFKLFKAGNQRVALGTTTVKSRVTLSKKHFSFIILYLGNHHLIGNTSKALEIHELQEIEARLEQLFDQGNISATLELIREKFTRKSFSFFDLFKDEQIKLLNAVLAKNVNLAATSYDKINDRNYSLMNVMKTAHLTVPPILRKNLEAITQHKLERLFESNPEKVSLIKLKQYSKDARKWNIPLDTEKLKFLATQKINSTVEQLDQNSNLSEFFTHSIQLLQQLHEIGVYPDLYKLQNFVFNLCNTRSRQGQEFDKLRQLAQYVEVIACD